MPLHHAGPLYVARKMAGRLAGLAAAALPDRRPRPVCIPAAACGGIRHEIHPAEPVHLDRPPGFDGRAWRSFKVRDIDRLPPSFVLELNEGFVLGEEGWVSPDGAAIVGDLWQEAGFPTARMPGAAAPRAGEPVRLDGTAAVLAMPWLPNYYHWTLQAVPRAHLVERAVGRDAIDCWILPPRPPAYAREWLGLLGIDPARTVEAGAAGFRCRRLVAPSIPAPNRHVPRWAMDYVRARLPGTPATPGRRLFIARRGHEKRRLLNAEAVLREVERHGFEPVFLDGRPVAEQAALFRDAEAIVAVHGAGLANIVHCRPGAGLLEILPANFIFPCYRKLAAVCGLRHEILIGSEMRVPEPFYRPDIDADLRVDVAALREKLAALG